MAWGAAATGTPRGHRLDRPGAVADAGVARRDHARPAARWSCSTWPAPRATTSRPPAAAATATTATSCSRPMDVPEAVELDAAGVPPRRRSGATRCWSSATTTSRTRTQSVDVDADRLRRRSRRRTGRSTARPAAPGDAKLVSPLGDAKQRDDVGYDLAEHYRACAARTDEMLAGVEPLVEIGFVDDAEVVVVAFGTPGQVRPRRRAASCGPRARASATSGRSRCSRSRPTAVAAAADGRAGRRGLREQPGPDGRRRAPRGARRAARSSSSAGSASTARASASRPTSTSHVLRGRIEDASLDASRTGRSRA